MLTHQAWSAWISVDGRELPQYKTTVEEEVTSLPHYPWNHTIYKVSCWIASEEGKEFEIHVAAKAQLPTTCRVVVDMDGFYAAGRGVCGRFPHEVQISGRKSRDLSREAPFLFSRLSLTDDESALRDVSHLKGLGIISVQVDRIVLIPGPAPPNVSEQARSIAEKGPIHEASKKAGAHCVSYGKARAIPTVPMINTQPLDGKPFVIFEFRYRSADLLRAQDIMPPIAKSTLKQVVAHRPPKRTRTESTTGPVVPGGEVKCEDDKRENVDDEIRALRERLVSLEKRWNRENKAEVVTRPAKKAKVEPLDCSKFIEGEVIDLT